MGFTPLGHLCPCPDPTPHTSLGLQTRLPCSLGVRAGIGWGQDVRGKQQTLYLVWELQGSPGASRCSPEGTVHPIQLFVSRQVQFKCLPCPYPHIKEVLPFSEEMQARYFLSISQNISIFFSLAGWKHESTKLESREPRGLMQAWVFPRRGKLIPSFHVCKTVMNSPCPRHRAVANN